VIPKIFKQFFSPETMKKTLIVLIVLLAVSSLKIQAQTVTVIQKAKLPSVIDESSGIEISDRNHIWSHNDSGGSDELYEFDSTGILLRTLHIQNSTNHDWEDLARDSAGNIYIGDFGNNVNDRTNLTIYKISNPDATFATSISSVKIKFDYPDQQDFPPADSLLNFDMEAFFWFNHSLYLFSKDRTVPYSGYTKLYRLPEDAGTYTAELIDSFYLGSGPYYLTSITSADISPDGKTVALLTGFHIYLFTNFSNDNFFEGNEQELNFTSLTQKEAVVFINNHEIYLTDEQTDTLGYTGKLYYAELSNFIPTDVSSITEDDEFSVFPNPSSMAKFQVKVNEKLLGSELKITNSLGQLIFKSAVLNSTTTVDLDLQAGIYFVRICDSIKRVIIY